MIILACLGLTACNSSPSASQPDPSTPAMVVSCVLCHGADGMGIEARSAPRLAGLDAAYLERQLAAFAEGRRGAGPGDRFGPQMLVIAKSLDAAGRKQASQYYAALKGAPTQAQDVAARSAAFDACASCHGPNGEGIEAMGAPRIAGQSAWYIDLSIRQFRDGARGYAPNDTFGQQMAAAAKGLSDAEIASLATQVEGMPAPK